MKGIFELRSVFLSETLCYLPEYQLPFVIGRFSISNRLFVLHFSLNSNYKLSTSNYNKEYGYTEILTKSEKRENNLNKYERHFRA